MFLRSRGHSMRSPYSTRSPRLPFNQSIQTPRQLLLVTTLNTVQSNVETIKRSSSFVQFKFIRARDNTVLSRRAATMVCELDEWAVGDCDGEQEQLGEFLFLFFFLNLPNPRKPSSTKFSKSEKTFFDVIFF
jgi:hypothetical protein